MHQPLADLYPAFAARLPTLPLADLPTPVTTAAFETGGRAATVLIKRDDISARPYGGNKVRKLEYVLARARARGARRIATFGAVGSNHAVATAIHAREAGFDCTCFLSHQSLKPGLGRALRIHQSVGTEIVAYGGNRPQRIATLRKYLQGRRAWVVPLGGSSWLGTVGFVNAGLELAAQTVAGDCRPPARIYIALGTMGSAAGLALGLALAGLDTEVHAVRVTDEQYANAAAAHRLVRKTADMMRHYGAPLPAGIEEKVRLVCRDEFFGEGYGRSTPAADRAVSLAADAAHLGLETTYTGKAMAALIADIAAGSGGLPMFWNTYNSLPLDVDDRAPPDFDVVPREFERYFD